jgi:Tfp pilus assembly protein PilF
LKEAGEKNPNNPVIRYHLGMAYFKNGDKELAKKELAKALALDPKFTGADEARTTLQALK